LISDASAIAYTEGLVAHPPIGSTTTAALKTTAKTTSRRKLSELKGRKGVSSV